MSDQKLYVVVRKDLSWPQRAVQAGHGLAELLINREDAEWTNGTLVYLRASGETELLEIKQELEDLDIKHKVFKEPDIGNELTSIASLGNNQIFQRLRLL